VERARSKEITMRKQTILAISGAFLLCASAGAAEGWGHYANGRFAYDIDIPPGFSEIVEPDNGDGGIAKSADGKAELRVWGGYVLDGDFADEAARRLADDQNDGWSIAYQAQKDDWASWSGTRGSQLFYQRAIEGCDGAAAYFRLDYPAEQKALYDGVVGRLVKSLRAAC
jgi:hypothetical protein